MQSRRRKARQGPGRHVYTTEQLESRLLLAIAPLAAEFRVNTTTADSQLAPVAATAADGSSFVAWQSRNQDGSGYGIYGRWYDSAGHPIGGEVRINTTTAYDQTVPTIAMDFDGNFLVAWQSESQDGSSSGVYARQYSIDDGFGSEFLVNTSTSGAQTAPWAAMDPLGDSVVVWCGPGGIFGQRYSRSGAPLGGEFRINGSTSATLSTPRVAMDADGDFAVVWQSSQNNGSHNGVYGQLFSSNGAAIGGELSISGIKSAPALAMDASGRFDVVTNDDTSQGKLNLRRFGADGSLIGNMQTITTGHGPISSYSAALDGSGELVVVWNDALSATVMMQQISPDGGRLQHDVPASATTSGTTTPVVCRSLSGDALVLWSASSTSVGDVYMRRYPVVANPGSVGDRIWNDLDGDGIQEAGEPGRSGVKVKLFTSDGTLVDSVTTDGYGNYLFQDLVPGTAYYLQLSPSSFGVRMSPVNQGSSSALDSDFDPTTQATALFTLSPGQTDMTLDAGLYGTWISGTLYDDVNADGAWSATEPYLEGWTIYVDSNQDGQLSAGEPVSVTSSTGVFSFSNLAPGTYSIRYVLQDAWQPSQESMSRQVTVPSLGQSFMLAVHTSAPLVPPRPFTPEVQVNAFAANDQTAPAAAANGAGDAVAVWVSHAQDGSFDGIYGQRMDTAGNKRGDEFRISSSTTGDQREPTVAIDDSGNFTVVWSNRKSSTEWDLVLRRYSAAGVPLGTETILTAASLDSQVEASIAMAGDGRFAVAWNRKDLKPGQELWMQRFDAAGNPLGVAVQVNGVLGAYGSRPGIALDRAGNVSVVWSRTDGTDIDLRRYGSDGTPLGGEAIISTLSGSYKAGSPAIAISESGTFAVAWQRQESSPAIYVRRFNSAGVPQGTEIKPGDTGNARSQPAITMGPDGSFYVAWTEQTASNGMEVKGLAFSAAGVPASAALGINLIRSGDQSTPAVAMDGAGRLLAVWASIPSGGNSDVVAASSPPIQATASVGGIVWKDLDFNGVRTASEPAGQVNPVITLLTASGIPVATTTPLWPQGTYRFDNLLPGLSYQLQFGQISGYAFTAAGAGLDPASDSDADRVLGRSDPFTLSAGEVDLTRDAGYIQYGAISLSLFNDVNGNGVRDPGELAQPVAVAYVDFNGNGQLDASEPSKPVEANGQAVFTGLDPTSLKIGLVCGPEWVLTTSNVALPQQGVTTPMEIGLRSNATVDPAEAAGRELQVSSLTNNPVIHPCVATNGSGGVVVWQTGSDISPNGIYAQLLDSSGNPIGSVFPVTGIAGSSRPAVAMDAAGNFAVAWTVSGISSGTADVYLQRFNSSGTSLTNNIKVNSIAALQSQAPVVAMSASGVLVVAWAGSQGIQARRWDASGVAGAEFAVSDLAGVSQTGPAIGMDASGNFVVSWAATAGSATALYARRFSPAGAPVGSSFKVMDSARKSTVAVAADGTFVVTGVSDATWPPLRAQFFSASGLALGSPILVAPAVRPDSVACTADASGFVVAYSTGPSALGRRYSAGGLPIGGEFLINETDPVVLSIGSVSLASGPGAQFTAAWSIPADTGSPFNHALVRRFTTGVPGPGVSGQVWEDTNANGVWDTGERGRDGLRVTLSSGRAGRVGITTTSGGGLWSFDQLLAGESYSITVTAPPGMAFMYPNLGSDDTRDSDVDLHGTASVTSDGSGSAVVLDAGLVASASLTGTLYWDRNADGTPQTSETRLGGWTVYLDGDGNGVLDPDDVSAVTDASGHFSMPATTPGTWRLRAVAGARWSVPAGNDVQLTAGSTTAHDLGILNPADPYLVSPASDVQLPDPTAHMLGTPAAAMNAAGDSALVWIGASPAGIAAPYSLLAQRFAPDGTPRGPKFVVTGIGDYSVAKDLSVLAAMAPGGDLGVIIQSGSYMMGCLYGAGGELRRELFRVNDGQMSPGSAAIAAGPSGEFVVVWSSPTSGLSMRRAEANAADFGSVIPIGGRPGTAAAAAIDASGNVLIVNCEPQVTAGRYTPAGVLLGQRFIVNTTTTGTHYQPQVGFDAQGGYVIGWSSSINSGVPAEAPLAGAYYQRFSATDAPLGAEGHIGEIRSAALGVSASGNFALVGVHTSSASYYLFDSTTGELIPTGDDIRTTPPALAMSSDGSFVVAWNNWNPGQLVYNRYESFTHSATITGVAWNDLDGDGFRSPGEGPLAGATVVLSLPGMESIAVVTDSSGAYRFNQLRPGAEYQLRIDPVPGNIFTFTHVGNDATLDSDFSTPGGTCSLVLAPGEVRAHVDAGLAPSATLSGVVFQDLNSDGIRQATEGGLAGWTLYLDQNDNGILDSGELTAISASLGAFSFGPLNQGTYKVRLAPQERWMQTTAGPVITIAAGDTAPMTEVGLSTAVRARLGTKSGGEQSFGANANYEINSAAAACDAAGNTVVVWSTSDALSSGIFAQVLDASGSPQGQPLRVSDPLSQTGWGTSSPAVAVNASGSFIVVWTQRPASTDGSIMARRFNMAGTALGPQFQLSSLTPDAQNPSVALGSDGSFVACWRSISSGIYIRQFDAADQPLGAETQVTPWLGGDRTSVAMDRNGNFAVMGAGRVFRMDAAGNPAGPPIDAGLTGEVAMNASGELAVLSQWAGVKAVKRYNAAGQQQGQPLQLGAGTNIGIDDAGQIVVSSISGSDVNYLIIDAGGVPATSWICADLTPPGIDFWHSMALAVRSDGAGFLLAWPHSLTGAADQCRLVSQNFALLPDTRGAAAGLAWDDLNGDGLRQPLEPGLPGLTVTLLNADGTTAATTMTSSLGGYRFDGLIPGAGYRVKITAPGETPTALHAGSDGSIDSDFDPVQSTASFVAGEQQETRLDAGFVAPGSISGIQFGDTNANGVQDPGEMALGSWVVFADLDRNGVQDANEPFATTDSSGAFTIAGIRPGPVSIVESPQPGWVATTPTLVDVVITGRATSGGLAFGNRVGASVLHLSMLGPEIRAGSASGAPAMITDSTGVTTIARLDNGNVVAQRFAADGAPLGIPLKVNTAGGSFNSLSLSADSAGNVIVAYGGTGWHYAQRLDASGARLGSEIRLNSQFKSQPPLSISMNSSGAFAVVWASGSTWFRLFDASGNPRSGEVQCSNTTTVGSGSVFLDDNGIATVAWEGYTTSSGYSSDAVLMRRFGPDGAPISPISVVALGTTQSACKPALTGNASGDTAIAWLAGSQIMVQRFDSAGRMRGGPLPAVTNPGTSLGDPAVALSDDGGLIVAWSAVLGSPYNDVFMQRFSPAGLKQGAQVRLNGTFAGPHRQPAISQDGSVDPIIGWTDDYNDGFVPRLVFRRLLPPDLVVQEDSGTQFIAGFAAAVLPDVPAITVDHPEWFAAPPVLTADGTLTFTPLPDLFGEATLTVTLAGMDRTVPLRITPVNDAPTLDPLFAASAAPGTSYAMPLAGLTPGADPGQKITVSLLASEPSFFSQLELVPAAGGQEIHYRVAANAKGSATVYVIVRDNGGTTPGTDAIVRTFTVTVPPDTQSPTSFISEIPDHAYATPSIALGFSEPVNGLNLADLQLTRDGQPVALSSGLLVQQDATHWILADLTSATAPSGTYVLSLPADGSGIMDQAGNALANSASVTWTVGNTLHIGGAGIPLSPGGSIRLVRDQAVPDLVQIYLDSSTAPAASVYYPTLSTLTIELTDDNSVTLDFSQGELVPADGLLIDGKGAERARLQVVGTATADAIAVRPDGITRAGKSVRFSGIAELGLWAGVFAIPADLNGLALAVGSDARLTMGASQRLSSLTIGLQAAVDLVDHELVVTYRGTSPELQIQEYVKDALASRNARGLFASKASDSTFSQSGRVLAVFDNHDAHFTSFAGQTLSTDWNQVLVKYTYLGDANADGKVDPTDYAIVDGLQGLGHSWITGDLNFDGKTTPDDYAQIDGNQGAGYGGAGGPQLTPVAQAPISCRLEAPVPSATGSTGPGGASNGTSGGDVAVPGPQGVAVASPFSTRLIGDNADLFDSGKDLLT